MGWDYTIINGVSVGFELLDAEQCSMISEEGKWGFAFDLFIFRCIFVKF